MPFDQLHRREFITLLGDAAAWPLAALALRNAIVASSDRRANPSADPALRSPITGIGSRSCARRKRPHGRAAEKRDELAAM